MIIHFLKDEKVTDQIISNFKDLKNNLFLIFSSSPDWSFIKVQNASMKHFNYMNEDINELIKSFKPSAILLHGLFPEFARTVLAIKEQSQLKIGWTPWGFDVYHLPNIKPTIYAPKTTDYIQEQKRIARYKNILIYKTPLKYFLKKSTNPNRISISEILEVYKRIDYCITYLKEDFIVYSNYYPNNMEYVHATFSTIDQYLGNNKNLELNSDAKNMLLGNSNKTENNHLDALQKIAAYSGLMKSDNVKIYTPLNYGSENKYKLKVIQKGKSIFGNNFIPLTEFLNREDYINLLRSCSVGVFYHYRQQALGNIIALLYLGARVYLASKSPVYQYLTRIGIVVFDLDKDFSEFKNSRLHQEAVHSNREILNSIFDEKQNQKDIENLIEVLN